jgi:hypothetical protein
MSAITYTFVCANFKSTDQSPDPDKWPSTADCGFTCSDTDFTVASGSAHDHLINEHGYQDTLQFNQDIANCITAN